MNIYSHKEKDKAEISIKIKFGSDFQKQVLLHIIAQMLDAFKYSAESHHKKTRVEYIVLCQMPDIEDYIL